MRHGYRITEIKANRENADILNKPVEIKHQSIFIILDYLYKALIIPAKETAVATCTVIH